MAKKILRSLLFTLFSCHTVSTQKVVIVGAGVSGLSAAYHLCEQDFCDITLLEAENRIGGRVNTVDFKGYNLEEGAQWIHGSRGNPVYKFLKGKTKMVDEGNGINNQNRIYRSSGNSTDKNTRELFFEALHLPDEITEYVARRKYNIIEWSLYDGGHASNMGARGYDCYRNCTEGNRINNENRVCCSIGNSTDKNTRKLLFEALDLLNEITEYAPRSETLNFSRKSLLDVAKTVWSEQLKTRNFISTDAVIEAIFNYSIIEWSLNDGGHASSMGAIGYDHYRRFCGPDLTVSSGYKSLLSHLTDNKTDSSIKLQREVKLIKWKINDSLSTKFGNSSIGPVLIEYEGPNGSRETMSADHVIVTVSLGYLKKHHLELFTPNLPIKKQKAIRKLQFGTVGKIFLYYENRFWKQGDFPIHLLWDSNKAGEEFGDDYRIFKELNLIEDFKEHFIFIWASEKVSDIIRNVSDSDVGKTMTRLLRKVMKNETIPFPDDMFVTRWGKNKHFLGSYSYTGIGETRITKRLARAPLIVKGVPRVLFAGEAMHDRRFSTVDGAFASGRNEANRLIQFLKGE